MLYCSYNILTEDMEHDGDLCAAVVKNETDVASIFSLVIHSGTVDD